MKAIGWNQEVMSASSKMTASWGGVFGVARSAVFPVAKNNSPKESLL